MRKIILLLFVGSTFLGISQNGNPASPYYNGFNWTLTGFNLKTALATKITATHTNFLIYTPGVWNALKQVDLDPTNSGNVLLIYGWEDGSDGDTTNDRTREKDNNGGANGNWNREHVFAQALGDPDLGQDGPGADAHMLRACDVQRNGSRSNKLYTNGSGNSGSVGSNWYPGDEWKGDVARIIMYMYLRYDNQCLPTYVTSGTTVPSDPNMVNLLLQWNAEDPVSQYEDNRNTYLGNAFNNYGQGNRNPFIDNPYLATLIWGGPIAQNRWPTVFLNSISFNLNNEVRIYPNPSNNDINIASTVALEKVEIVNLNGQIIYEHKYPERVNDIFTVTNLPKGFYLLKLRSNNKSLTKKILIN